MKSHTVTRALLPLAFCALGGAAFAQQPAQPAQPQAPQEKMTFFITSVGKATAPISAALRARMRIAKRSPPRSAAARPSGAPI